MPDVSLKDFYNLGLAGLLGVNPDVAVIEGDVTDKLLAGAAAMADRCDQERASDHLALTVEGAYGDDLTKLADDRYSIVREAATSATVTLSFSRPSAGGGEPAGTIPTGFEVATQVDVVGRDVRFTTDSALNWGLGEIGTKTVQATATISGTDGNVDKAHSIVRKIGNSFDPAFSVTNTTPAAGGNNEESDESVKRRIRERPVTLRKGTRDAVIAGAKTVPSVRVADGIELPVGGGIISVSDETGASNAQMVNDVIIELENWRAFGVPITVQGGVRSVVDMTVAITLTTGKEAALAGLIVPITDSIEGAIEGLTQGQTLYDTLMITAAKNVAPDLIQDVTVTSLSIDGISIPIGDYAPAGNELLRPGSIVVVSA